MWSPNELLKIEKQRDILSYITLQFFHFKKVPLEHCPLGWGFLFGQVEEGFEQSNASVRWTLAECRLAGIHTLVYQIPPSPP